jgi:ABC-type transport system involved in multi-copper enzyme maturation permease subunit
VPDTTSFTSNVIRVYRQPAALEAIVRGLGDASGRVSGVNNRMENRLAESKYESNPFASIFSTFDLLFVVKMVLSLFAMLFAYDAVSGEKEKGTLKMALANNVARSRLILGKAIGGYVSLVLPLLVPLLIGAMFISLNSDMAFGGEDWMRLSLLYGMFLLYLSAFFALGLFVSSLTSRSSSSFFTLLFIWIVLVLIVPKVSAAAAGWIRPAPFAHETLSQKTRVAPQVMQEIDTDSLRKLWSTRPDRPTTIEGMRDPAYIAASQKFEEDVSSLTRELGLKYDTLLTDAYKKIDSDHRIRQEAQRRLAKNLARVSPASGLTFGGMVLTRTGMDEYNRFLSATRDYRAIYSDWLVRNGMRNEVGTDYRRTPLSIADMPQFEFEPESLGESLTRTLPDFALMAAMTIIFLTGAFFAFQRYDVR